ncbi:MAG: hypothetical protein AAF722_07620 [Cyanobacteria bacterium P01_C01_bin.70]
MTGLNPDIPADLPLDLAIEVDIASVSEKNWLFIRLSIPELWLYRQGQLKFFYLETSLVLGRVIN